MKRDYLTLERQATWLAQWNKCQWEVTRKKNTWYYQMSDNEDDKKLCLTLKKGKRICLGTNNKSQENDSTKGSNEETRQKKTMSKQIGK